MQVTAANNPFAQQRLEQLAFRFPDAQSWQDNLARLQQLGNRVSIVGRRGTGKSTLLRELQRIFDSTTTSLNHPSLLLDIPRRATFREHNGADRRAQLTWLRRQLLSATQQTWILVDGIERLCWPDRWWFVRRWARPELSAGLVATLHRPQPTLRLSPWIRTKPSETLLSDLLNELGVHEDRWHRRARQLWSTRCRRSVRETFRCLYDEYSRDLS